MFSLATRVHAALDYSFSLFLMLAPAIFGFGEADAETVLPIVAGVLICFYSFFTKYEGGLYHFFPLKLHYLFDLIIGLLITFSPWIFGFNDMVYKPHFYIGLGFSILAFASLAPMIRWNKLFEHKQLGQFIGSH